MNLRLQTVTQDSNEVLNEGFKTVEAISKTLKDKFMIALNKHKK